MMVLAPVGAKAEVASLADTAREVEVSPPASSKAALVLSRTAAPDAQPFARLWSEVQADVAARHPNSVHTIALMTGHDEHHGQPGWLVLAVTNFLKSQSPSATHC